MNRYPAIALKRKKKSFDDDEGIDDGIAVRANLLYCEKRRLSIEKKGKKSLPSILVVFVTVVGEQTTINMK